VPPGLAKKGGLPSGLAKKFGPTVLQQAYIAVDPRHDDRAWFLVGDRWVLRRSFDPASAPRSARFYPSLPRRRRCRCPTSTSMSTCGSWCSTTGKPVRSGLDSPPPSGSAGKPSGSDGKLSAGVQRSWKVFRNVSGSTSDPSGWTYRAWKVTFDGSPKTFQDWKVTFDECRKTFEGSGKTFQGFWTLPEEFRTLPGEVSETPGEVSETPGEVLEASRGGWEAPGGVPEIRHLVSPPRSFRLA
jgi:hypothetical protein